MEIVINGGIYQARIVLTNENLIARYKEDPEKYEKLFQRNLLGTCARMLSPRELENSLIEINKESLVKERNLVKNHLSIQN